MNQQRYIAHFQPQAWVGDYAVDVDAQGEQEWDCTSRFKELSKEHIDPDEVEAEILDDGWWLDSADVFHGDDNAPDWVNDYEGPFTITVRHRTQYDDSIPQVREPEPELLTPPSADALLQAIKSHRIEVYGDAPPNFVWDIELYQDAGLLPEDYVHPSEDDLHASIYVLRKALKALIVVAGPVSEKLVHGAYVHHPEALLLANTLANAKMALAAHGNAKEPQ